MMLFHITCVVVESTSQVVKVVTTIEDLMIIVMTIQEGLHQVCDC